MSLKLIVLALVLAVAAARKPYQGFFLPPFGGRIVGGKDAAPGEFPWQISLQYGIINYSHFCGGSILNANYVLTAAHCADALPSYMKIVAIAGKYNLKKQESTQQSVTVVKRIVHDQYGGDVGPYDIALLKLEKPLKFNEFVQPIDLPKAGSVASGETVLSGWGSISSTNSPVMPDILQTVKLPVVPVKECDAAVKQLTGSSPVENSNVCTGPLTGGVSACNGDSGGPLIQYVNGKPVHIGVVSWGIVPCGTKGAPSVYTQTSSYIDWIENAIAEN